MSGPSTTRENRIRRLRRRLPRSKRLVVCGNEAAVAHRWPDRFAGQPHGSIADLEMHFATRKATEGFRPAMHYPCALDDGEAA